MKRFRLLGIIVLTSFLFCTSCKKSDPGQPPVYLSYELKSYFDYQPGSYWIYRDTLAPATSDSFTVYSYTDDTASVSGVSTETVTVSMHAYTLDTTSILDSAEWDIVLQQNNSNLIYGTLPQNGAGYHSISYSPFTQGTPFSLAGGNITTPGCSGTTAYTINFLTDYNIIDSAIADTNGTYSNVYQMHYQELSGGCALSSLNDWMYLTQSFGIVKMNIRNSYLQKVLELQRCYINR